MNRLLEIGFEPAGHWILDRGKLFYELFRHATQRNVLYAFICDGDVKYVGKTVQSLAMRMSGYRNPGQTQTTNINVSGRIRSMLQSRAAVEILVLPDNGLLHYGQFHINLAAALEDDIIRLINPEWNGGARERVAETLDPAAPIPDTAGPDDGGEAQGGFEITLQPTYYRSGFFNIGVSAQHYIGADGETIELFLGDAAQPVLGMINRRANTNGTPRIMGGTALRNWFQAPGSEMDVVRIEVISPNALRLRIHRPR